MLRLDQGVAPRLWACVLPAEKSVIALLPTREEHDNIVLSHKIISRIMMLVQDSVVVSLFVLGKHHAHAEW
jgi:hypothetical protein